MVNFMNINGFEGLHGRPIPVGIGAKIANKDLNIVIITGDGDCLGEGLNHFVTAARGNHNITVIIHDNQTYGLTTGQTAPTSEKGMRSKSTPKGVIEDPINPMSLALTANASFVSTVFTGYLPQMTKVIEQAFTHKGFALVNAFQPCVTYNKINTYDWYRQNAYHLDSNHDAADKRKAIDIALQKDKLALGIYYKEDKPTYDEQEANITDTSLIQSKQKTDAFSSMINLFK